MDYENRKLDTIKKLFNEDIKNGNLIIEDQGIEDPKTDNGVIYHYVSFYIRHASTAQPVNDNDYCNIMIMSRDITTMTSEDITNQLLVNLVDRLKSANQDIFILKGF